MSQQVKSIRTLAKLYFILLAIAILFILLAGLLTGHPRLGPIVAIIGFGTGLVANILAVFVIPIRVLMLNDWLKGKR